MSTSSARPRISATARVLPGAFIAENVIVEEDALIGHAAVLLGPDTAGASPTLVSRAAEIGANATVLPGITIGLRARVMPGAVVTRSVPPLAIVEGNPARITGYIATPDSAVTRPTASAAEQASPLQSRVAGVTLHRLRMVPDLRGTLTAGEFAHDIPFTPRRYFVVFEVPTAETRGEHAHRECAQFLIAMRGSVRVVADNGEAREEFVLDRPDLGLFLPPMTWGIQYRYTPDAILLVFASDYYDPADYIRDYNEFLSLTARRPEP